ncbi:hypothetical protein COU12_01090 [Candidatus Jorgensenbacteria bacterium CG10_big_fil_rev_8_21_14_0_10_54_38]|uniref:Uncharacterized protein n=1 Tax=Candidatus Jorgensenbacteria bacterium CG10_big_fil_rev_8_21_14_0_10_54_38 TaxID=1974593 RepID=A0A2M6WG84_9BACT|nr:MAG: hypothetical protein COU12_01090 [Candidatus Jorgensenbacteria bacterium CG10_big_fil_rev_8_21_14_0_10_54_38]
MWNKIIKNPMGRLGEKGNHFRREMREKVTGYLLAAFGLVAGLAWNEAIKGLIDYLFPLSQNSLIAKFGYAGLITIFVAIMSVSWYGSCRSGAKGAGPS